MIIRNKKNGSNVLAFGGNSIIIRGGEVVDIAALTDFNQIVNKADFGKRGWFEIIEKKEIVIEDKKNTIEDTETDLEKAKKEVIEYVQKNKEE